MDVPHRGLRATVRHRLPPELLGFQVNFGLEQGATPITAVLKDSQGSCCHTMEVCGRQDILQKTWAPIEELLDDEVVVHGVPPDEKGKSWDFIRIRHGPPTYNPKAHPFKPSITIKALLLASHLRFCMADLLQCQPQSTLFRGLLS
jgi:hypothetical protein